MEWPDIDPEWVFREQPKHSVAITQPFYLGTYEVTVGQFKQFVSATNYRTDNTWLEPDIPQAHNHPVIYVTWQDAQAFAKWLSDGGLVCLPTEAEWEYAARAGTTTRFPNGDDAEGLAAIANVADADLVAVSRMKISERISASDGFAFTAPVGQFPPNQFGIHDTIGNVHEWCQDWHGKNYYRKSADTDPQGPRGGTVRVCRGGGWYDGPRDCRVTNRGWLPPQSQYFNLGFRLVRVIRS